MSQQMAERANVSSSSFEDLHSSFENLTNQLMPIIQQIERGVNSTDSLLSYTATNITNNMAINNTYHFTQALHDIDKNVSYNRLVSINNIKLLIN